MRRTFTFASIIAFALCTWAAPAGAAVDTNALILDPPAPGFKLATGPDEWTGQVDREGTLVQPGHVADGTNGFVAGHVKSFGRDPDTGDRLAVLVAEFSERRFAVADIESEPETEKAGARVTRFDIASIPDSRGYSWEDELSGVSIRFEAIGFVRGTVTVYVVGIGLPPGIDRSILESVAVAQHAHVSSVVPDDGSASDASPSGIGLAVVAAVLAGMLAAAVLVVVLIVRGARRKRAPATTWATLGGHDDLVAGRSAAPAGAGYPPSYAPPTPVPGPPPYNGPSPVPGAPPYAPPPPAPAPGGPAPAHGGYISPSPAASAVPVAVDPATLPPQECPSCGNMFGPGDTCAACQHLRTMCAMCGTRIWAGAMTCAAHSGAVRNSSY